jgi:hypothetical protein
MRTGNGQFQKNHHQRSRSKEADRPCHGAALPVHPGGARRPHQGIWPDGRETRREARQILKRFFSFRGSSPYPSSRIACTKSLSSSKFKARRNFSRSSLSCLFVSGSFGRLDPRARSAAMTSRMSSSSLTIGSLLAPNSSIAISTYNCDACICTLQLW